VRREGGRSGHWRHGRSGGARRRAGGADATREGASGRDSKREEAGLGRQKQGAGDVRRRAESAIARVCGGREVYNGSRQRRDDV